MNHTFETSAWVSSPRGMIQLPVIVEYEHDGGRPEVYRVSERDDPEADLTTLISDAEHDIIYFKVATELRAKQVEYADELLQGER